MKSAAVFIILSLAAVAVMSKPQESQESKEQSDPCQLMPVVQAKCGASADFGNCTACLIQHCYEQAMKDETNCEAHKTCINGAACA